MSKETSQKIATLSSAVLSRRKEFRNPWDDPVMARFSRDDLDAIKAIFNPWVDAARSLAGSAMAQSETDRLQYHDAQIDLDGMLIATTLANLIREEGGGRSNITISPKDIAETLELYELEDNRDGLLRTIKIKPRDGTTERLRLMWQDEDTTNAKPQAEPKPERPVWAIRYWIRGAVHLARMLDKADAGRQLLKYGATGHEPPSVIENRMCMHNNCPAEHCNLEATSDS